LKQLGKATFGPGGRNLSQLISSLHSASECPAMACRARGRGDDGTCCKKGGEACRFQIGS
jgi:hypothetical protein